MFKDVGVKYIVIILKYYDGFVMYDSKVFNFDIVDSIFYKKDFIKELVNLVYKYGL